MAGVDSGFADWLKKGALFLVVAPGNAAAWAGKGVATEIVTPYASRASVAAEGARQVAFLSGPIVRDSVVVAGARKDLLGKAVALRGDRLGYTAAGLAAFVLGIQEQTNGTTILSVLRPI